MDKYILKQNDGVILLIVSAISKISSDSMELIDNQLKNMLCCIDGYNKDMSIEETIDLLNSRDIWIECSDGNKFREYVLKDRAKDKDLAMFRVGKSQIKCNEEELSYKCEFYISDIIKYQEDNYGLF